MGLASGLTRVTIPSSVANIANYAFSGCTSLTAVYFLGNAPIPGGIVRVRRRQQCDDLLLA